MRKSILLLFISAVLFNSCSSDDSNQESGNPTENNNSIRLANNTTLGNILTDENGMSLYFFSKDSNGESACVDGCVAAWPIFYSESLTLDEGLSASDFAQITRADGEKQTTYKGWPLYYFANDNAVGDTNGDKFGNNWFVAKPDYSLMYVQAQLVGRDQDGNDKNFKGDYTPGNELTFYITDDRGRTLYAYKFDDEGKNNYTAQDFSNNAIWPVFHVDIDKLPSILNPNDFGVINVFGESQLTFKGRPLYYFGQDVERGDNYGISVPTPGIWPIVN
ncbi:hypothetical protein A8C32_15295 [Flavivirga aquatica]|uniref:Lipoprotein n=1 Tax=Flavivirga aquatica TaxID=1849968 RepID=A0A1E5T8Y4_9FLAO|nr:hypothetical protein [Flavivirga aquatica]OEK07845.1 hypothetical protein A8C32_15295 [Flavivirga aquatica]